MRKPKKKIRRPTAPRQFPIRPLLIALVAVAGVVGIWNGLQSAALAVTTRLENAPETFFSLDQATITPKPDWLLVDPVRSAFQEAEIDPAQLKLARHDLAETIGRALLRSPWIAQVTVRKGYQSLSIDIRYRQPALCVPFGGDKHCYYLSEDAVLLPIREEVAEGGLRHCLVAEGLPSVDLPDSGQRIRDPRIQAAARLAGYLAEDKARLDLLVIIASEDSAEGVIGTIKTRRGSQIRWGKVTDRDVDTEMKLGRLIHYAAENGSLELPDGPYEFDVSREDSLPVRLVDKVKDHRSALGQ
jgi:hypothetical protein